MCEIVLVVGLFGDSLLHFGTYIFGLEAKLFGHKVDGFGVKTLVDRHHDTYAHQGSDNLVYADVHHGSQFAHRYKLGKLQYLALLLLFATLFVQFFLNRLAFFLAVFGSLLVLILFVGEACQRFFYLACYVLIAYLNGLRSAVAVFLFLSVASTTIASSAIATAVVVATTVVALLVSGCVDVDTHLVNALALLLSVALLLCFLLTFLALLFLRLLLGTSALVQCGEVNLS